MTNSAPDLITKCSQNEGFQIFFTHVPTDQTVGFVAFLDTWEDKWEQKWNSQSVYGRMDPIATYQRTERKISFSFKILNFDIESGFKNMDKFSQLVNFQYPEYFGESASTIKTPPLIKLKFSNWTHNEGIKGLLGFLDGVNYSPNMEAGVLTYDGPGTKTFHHMPKELAITCGFTVLHTHKLGWKGSSARGSSSYPHNYSAGLESIRNRSANKIKEAIRVRGSVDDLTTLSDFDVPAANAREKIERIRDRFIDELTGLRSWRRP